MTRILIAVVFIVLGSNNAHADTTRQSPFRTAEQLGRALVLIENRYVTPADRTTLLEGAIRGMVAELDPHSSYMTRTQYETFRNDTEGRFVGVGVEVNMRDGVLTVIRPIEGSPAERGGVLAGDLLVAVDGWFTQGKRLDDVLKRIRGELGTRVRLHTHVLGVDQPMSLSIVRGEVHTRSVVGQDAPCFGRCTRRLESRSANQSRRLGTRGSAHRG